MADATPTPQSRREAVQPSLWDRLIDDLPGIIAETDRRQSDLAAVLGLDRLNGILAQGTRGIERDTGLTDLQRRELHLLIGQMDRRGFLEQRGIVVTADVLREAVRRDIEALFNIERFESGFMVTDLEREAIEEPSALIADFPLARRSVLNYGVPSFSGRGAKDFDLDALARELREVVAVFEPRLKRDTIRVKADTGDAAGMRISIEGTLMLSPIAERLRLSTTINLDNGRASTVVEEV
jgi:type VI secretion system protein ImpF